MRRPGFLTRYAKHAGISKQVAAYQLQQCGVNYHAFFDFEEADRLRAAWLTESSNDGDGDDESGAYAEAKARDRHFKACITELEYRKRVGELVERDAVDSEWFRIGRQVRDRMLNIPPRLAGILAVEMDQQKVSQILNAEILRVLEVLATDENKGTEPRGAVGEEGNQNESPE